MFQTSGLRIIATTAAIAVITSITALSPAAAASKYASTDAFLKSTFTDGKFIEGFTPGKADYGFTLEGILQRVALGESKASLAPAITYNLENAALSGDASSRSGFLFDAKGNLKLGLAGKWLFTSAAAKANNLKLRKAIQGILESKIDNTGDLAPDTKANTYDRAWAVLGLEANGEKELSLAVALNMAGHQVKDGGFNDGWTLGSGSPDGSGIVLQALASVKNLANKAQQVKLSKIISSTVSYLKATLVGGDHYESYGDYNINGTEYAAMGLTAVGKPNAAIKAFIASKLATDGGIQSPWSGGAGDTYATAQGGAALLGKSYLDLVK